ncbi:hypothetical protein C0J52_01493 [Blattella germanica]|nr:hypothetical protein C0J52_01493 [Blattella germanica]
MPRKVKAPSERKDINILMAQRIVYERKHKSPRKRVDSVRSNEELEVAEEASGSFRFVFPPPPPPPIPCVSRRPVSASPYFYNVSDSDSQSDSGRGVADHSSPIAIRHPLITFRGYQSDGSPVALQSLPRFLPPIGVFWDIENCQSAQPVDVVVSNLPDDKDQARIKNRLKQLYSLMKGFSALRFKQRLVKPKVDD